MQTRAIVPYRAPTFRTHDAVTDVELYLCATKGEAEMYVSNDNVPLPTDGYFGLRECREQAVLRARRCGAYPTEETHCFMQVTFTPSGIAYFANKPQPAQRRFAAVLWKKTYKKVTSKHGGVWKFYEPLPVGRLCQMVFYC